MIARLANLRKYPSVFPAPDRDHPPRCSTTLAAVVVPAVEAARRRKLDRPDRGAGRSGAGTRSTCRSPTKSLLAVTLAPAVNPTNEVLGVFVRGCPNSTASRAIARCLPALERAGRDTMRMARPRPRADASGSRPS